MLCFFIHAQFSLINSMLYVSKKPRYIKYRGLNNPELFFFAVHSYEFIQICISCFCFRFVLSKQSCCFFRILTLQENCNELLRSGSPCSSPYPVSLESRANFLSAAGLKRKLCQYPALNCQFFFCLSFCHTLLDTMVDTWSVCNDQRRSRISFCFSDCFNSLVEVSTHRDLCYVYIAIAHCDGSHIFLLGFFTASCELSDCTCRCRFRGLSACVGVNLCIEYHNVDVTSACENMVNTTESDIVSPSVTTEDPLGFLGQIIFLSKDFFCCVTSACFQSCDQFVCCCTVSCSNSRMYPAIPDQLLLLLRLYLLLQQLQLLL